MYEPLLFAHSWIRWVVVAAGFYLVLTLFLGWLKKKDWKESDDQLSAAFGQIMAYQLIVGFLIYLVFSPIVKNSFLNFSYAIKNPIQVYWMIYHGLAMSASLAIYEIARRRIIKSGTSRDKFRRMLLTSVVSFLLVVAAIPWPFLSYGRNWFRGF